MIKNEHPTMKTLPPEQRPYELCLRCGPGVLSDAQLLAVILRTGTQGESCVELAARLLQCPGSPGLSGLFHMTTSQMMQLKGIGRVKAVQLQCIAELSRRIAQQRFSDGVCFTDPRMVADYYMEAYRHEEQEKVLLIMLSSKGRLIAEQVISVGTVNAAMISPREIFLTALRHGAVSIILLHNHPSGRPDPSKEDIELTHRVADSGQMLGIALLDHIIIGDREAVSFREQGLL